MAAMMTDDELHAESVARIRWHVSGFRLVRKRESRFHRAVGGALAALGEPRYRDSYHTTLGYTCAEPDLATAADWPVLWHEGLHALQSRRLTRLGMGLLYLFPQWLAVPFVALGAVLWTWWPLAAAAACLLPLPAYFRMRSEAAAYAIGLAVRSWTGLETGAALAEFSRRIAGREYYWAWPWRRAVMRRLERELARAEACADSDPYLAELRGLLADAGLLAGGDSGR